MPGKQHSAKNGGAGWPAPDNCVRGGGQSGLLCEEVAATAAYSLAPLSRGEGWGEGLLPQILKFECAATPLTRR